MKACSIAAAIIVPLDQLIAFAVFAISVASPAKGLLLVAVLAPLGGDAVAGGFVAGWLMRALPDRPGPRVAAPILAWLFCALVAGSLAGVGADPAGVAAASRHIIGFALAAATVKLFRQRPELSINLPAALAAGGCIAVGLAFARASSIDWPALAASRGLVAGLAAGMSVRAGGRARAVWAAASLWLLAGVLHAAARSPQMITALQRTQPSISASIRAASSTPWFGIGIGRDPATTPLFDPESAAAQGGIPESHNLLAIGVELGAVGLALWVIWIGAGLLRAVRALSRDAGDARLWGAAGGVAFYIAALAVGRPLAFSATAFPFLIQFGLMTGLAGSTLLDATPVWTRRPRWQVVTAAIAMVAIAAGGLISARRGPPAVTEMSSRPAAVAAIPRSK